MTYFSVLNPPTAGEVDVDRSETFQKRLRDVLKFCAENAGRIDCHDAFPIEELDYFSKMGLLSAPLDVELGGQGLGIKASSVKDLLSLLKQIGRANLSVGRIYEGHVNALQLIQTFGTPEQIKFYARDVQVKEKIFGVWNAEAEDGVKILPLGNGKYQLKGSKTFATGCGYVDRPFVNGVLPDGGWQMCIVPMDEVQTNHDPNWWKPMGMRATASYKVDFTGVEIDQSALIGQPNDYYRQPWLTAGVVRFAAVQLGGAEALFDHARQFLQELERTKDPYQEERFGKAAIAIENGNLWLRGAAKQLSLYAPTFGGSPSADGLNPEPLVAYASMVRTVVEQVCMDVLQLVERSVGTRGLLPPNPMERIVRDLTLYLRQPAFDIALATVGKFALQSSASAEDLWSK